MKRLIKLRESDPEKWTYRKLGEKFGRSEATMFHHYKNAKETGKNATKKKGKPKNSVTRKPTKKETKTETELELRLVNKGKSKSKKRPKDVCVVVIDGPGIYLECQAPAKVTQEMVAAVIKTARSG